MKLMQNFPEERGTVLKVLEEMNRLHLLNDHHFTEQYVAHLIQKPIGRLKIMMETRKRGLEDEMVEQALLDAGYDEAENCRKAMEQKATTLRDADERKRKQKLMNFLKNRGFRDNTIFRTVK